MRQLQNPKLLVVIGLEITLISSTPHALEIFTMPIITFLKKPNQHRIVVKTNIQILNQDEPMELTNVIIIEGATNQLVVEDEVNLKSLN
jgi:hypothetical protein